MNRDGGVTGLLFNTGADASAAEDFVGETIRSSSDALLTIINDILDFPKGESGRWIWEQHPRCRACEGIFAPRQRKRSRRLALPSVVLLSPKN